MNDSEVPSERPSTADADVVTLIIQLGKIVSFVDLYGTEHNMARAAMHDGYTGLSSVLAESDEFSINLADKNLFVNSRPVESKNPLVARFVDRLRLLEIYGFTIRKGMTQDEFGRLLGLLTVRDAAALGAGFSASLAGGAFGHVSATKSVLRQVEEDEVVVKKDEPEEPGRSEYDDNDVRQIIAFLKGDISAGDQDALKDPDMVANNIDKLSELMMQSVAIRQRAANIENGESVGDLLVGCLRRTFDGLSSGKSARTQKGRKKIAKTLVMLEKSILDKLRVFAGDAAGDVGEEVAAATEEMQDEINVEGLASDYLRRRKAAEESEEKLLRLMKAKDHEWLDGVGLEETLVGGGLGVSGWQKLVAQSEAGARLKGAAGTGVAPDTVGTLALVLNELTRLMEEKASGVSSDKLNQRVSSALDSVNHEVEAVIQRTEQKIDTLAGQVGGTGAAGGMGAGDGPTAKKKTLSVVSEIVQELCQPLTVINCTIEMLNGDNFGKIPEAGRQPLSMAGDCALRMKKLADRLVQVCGVPESLEPESFDQ